jgi:WD40 repeat protein
LKQFESDQRFYSVCGGVSPDRRLLVIHESGVGDNGALYRVKVIDLATGKLLPAPDVRYTHTYDIAFTPDSRAAAVAAVDGAFLWNLADGKLVQRLATGSRRSVSFSGDGRRLVVAGIGPIEVYRSDGTLLRRIVDIQLPTKAVLTHDGRAVIVGNAKGEVQICRLSD